MRRRPSFPRVFAATGVSAVLIATALFAPHLAVADPAPVATGDAQSAATSAEALTIAQQYDHPVLVDGATTETETVTALPSGGFQLDESSEPVRVKTNAGWTPVDTNLAVAGDGTLAPAATSAGVAFSGGGNGPLATVATDGGARLAVSWPLGSLPAPTVSGNTATYGNVLPDVDLQLAATATGMSEVLAVNSAQAAANPQLDDLAFGLHGITVTPPTSSGGVATATASDGTVLQSVSPTWWDSSDGGSPAGPGDKAVGQPATAQVSSTVETVQVGDAASTPGVTYPVYVDPDWTQPGPTNRTFIDSAYPTQSYWNGANASDGYMHVGYINSGNSDDGRDHTTRSYWAMDTSAMIGKHVLAAHFNTTEAYSSSCTATGVHAFITDGISPSTTWNSAPGNLYPQQDESFAHGYSGSCPVQAVGFDVTDGITRAAANRWGAITTIGLVADDPSDWRSWKKFTGTASLTVTYNTPPTIQDGSDGPGNICGSVGNMPAYNNSGNAGNTIVLQANAYDADGGNVDVNFYLYHRDPSSGAITPVYSNPIYRNTGLQAQGYHSFTVPSGGLTDGQYIWSADASDWTDISPTSTGCLFEVKNEGPATAPAVTWTAGVPSNPVVGQTLSVTVTVNPNDEYRTLAYWAAAGAGSNTPDVTNVPINPGANRSGCSAPAGGVRYVCLNPGATTATLNFAATDAGQTTLYVAGVDRAGNLGGGTNFANYETLSPSPDTVGMANGHDWLTSRNTPPATQVPDSAETPTAQTPLPITVGNGVTYQAAQLPDGSSPANSSTTLSFEFRDFGREYNNSDHQGVTEGIPTDPSFHIESELGRLYTTNTTGTLIGLYRCFIGSDEYDSIHSDCEGVSQPGTTQLLGYLYPYSAAPTNVATVTLYRCLAGGTEHFDSISTTNICEGQPRDSGRDNGILGKLVADSTTATASKAVDTSKSFTVSAWLRPDDISATSGFHTAVSEDGATNSGFYLQEWNGNWRFCMRSQDAADQIGCVMAIPTNASASSPTSVTAGWTFVTGVYDAANQQVRLYVGTAAAMKPQNSATYAPAANSSSASGALVIGSAKNAGMIYNNWNGQISDVSVFQGVPTVIQLQHLAGHYDAAGQPIGGNAGTDAVPGH